MGDNKSNDINAATSEYERELDAALAQSRADETSGRYVTESARAHMDRLGALFGADVGDHDDVYR